MTVLCPVCQTPITTTEDGGVCRKGHRFDRARSGYMHLLPANRKHAKNPGDDKLMVDARRKFLDKGYYRPLADTVSRLAGEWLANLPHQTPCVLDAGCGEGYYTTLLYDALCQRGMEPDILGVDISKLALDKAAKRQKAIFYVVASVFHLPAPDACCDLLCSLFSPYCSEEYQRVIRPGGAMLLVIPGENHLWELKQAIYERPYKNQVKPFALEGFTLLDHMQVHDTIYLAEHNDIENLFKMTPYYYKTSEQDQARLLGRGELTTQIEFEVLLYRK
ncbi:putative RNA methyltransferase [Anaeromassilibacillus sp. SJQ-5]